MLLYYVMCTDMHVNLLRLKSNRQNKDIDMNNAEMLKEAWVGLILLLVTCLVCRTNLELTFHHLFKTPGAHL